jgi:MFS transporter, DHA1 family, tetracycline resistance protein
MSNSALSAKQTNNILYTLLLTVFIDLLGVTIVIPIVAPLFLDLKNGLMPFDFAAAQGPNSAQVLKDAIHHRTIIFSLLIASFPLAQFFGAPYLGALADKIGRKKVLTVSLIGTLIGYVLFVIGIHYQLIWLLFVSRILDGFTGGNIAIAFSSIADISTPENKTKNFGMLGAAFGLGFIIGPYIGGKLADSSIVSWFSYEIPYVLSCILCVINIFMVVFLFKETLKQKIDRPISIFAGFTNLKDAFLTSNTRVIFTIVFLITFGFSIFTQFWQVFLMQKFQGMTTSKVGDFFAYIGIFIAITQGGLTGFFSKRYTPSKVFAFTGVLLGLSFIIIQLPNSLFLLYLVSPLVAFSQGLLSPNLQTMVSNSAGPEQQGKILGINQSVQSLAQAIPPLIAAYALSVSANGPLILASFFTFVAWAVFIIFYKK